MTDQKTLLDDLDFAAKLAREGASTPLLGGIFFVIWSALLAPTLVIHGLTVSNLLPIPPNQVGMIWFIFGITGTVLTIYFDRKNKDKRGCATFLNKLARQAGFSVHVLIFGFVAAVLISVAYNDADIRLFNMIIPVSFGFQALQMSVLGRLSNKNYLKNASYIAGIAMMVTLILNQRVEIYYLSAFFIVFSMMRPGILEIKAEREHARK